METSTPQPSDQDLALMNELARYALRFSAPIAFCGRGKMANETKINNGTIALVKLHGHQFGITNHHVIDEYRDRQNTGEAMVGMVGNVEIDPLVRVHSESAYYDLVVLDLKGVDVTKIRGGTEIPCQFLDPRIWPAPMPEKDQWILFGGFPGIKRQILNPTEVEFGTMSSGGTRVHSVQPDVFTAQVEIEQCIISFDRDGRGFEDLPGISGCPVMMGRVVGGVAVIDLVGVVFEYFRDWDLMRMRPITLIGEDGYIISP